MENFVLYNEISSYDGQIIYKSRKKGTISYLAISSIEKRKRALVTNHVRFAHVFCHDNILRFHEWYETCNHFWIVMDLCTGGTLESMMRDDGEFPEPAIANFGSQLVEGLSYIHSHSAIFADWCPRRILLDGNGRIKFYDFSYSRMENESAEDVISNFLEEDILTQTTYDGISRVALPYIAPEIIRGSVASKSSDVWGLGCILYQMFFGRPPFLHKNQSQIVQMILKNELVSETSSRKPSSALWNLLVSILDKAPSQRISLEDIKRHSFWNSEIHELRSMTPPTDSEDVMVESVIEQKSTDVKVEAINGYALPISEVQDESRKKTAEPNSVKQNHANSNSGTECLASGWEKENSPPIGMEVPIGSATFSLHAEACPVTFRSNSSAQTISETGRNTSTYGNPPLAQKPNDCSDTVDSSDTSSPNDRQSLHRNLTRNVSNDVDSALFNSDDALDSMSVPLPVEHRMTRSEYVLRDDGSHKGSLAPISPFSFSKQTDIASPKSRSCLALLFPWGNKSLSLPQVYATIRGFTENQLERIFQDELDPITNSRAKQLSDYPESQHSFWRPRPLCDYDQWVQHPPHIRLRSEARLLGNIIPILPKQFGLLSLVEIEEHANLLLQLLRNPESVSARGRPSSRVAYVAWFLSGTTLLCSKTEQRKPQFIALLGTSIQRTRAFLLESVGFLKSLSSPIPAHTAETRAWFCRIISLLAFRSADLLNWLQFDPEHEALRQAIILQIGPLIPMCITVVVEVLRESGTQSHSCLKHSVVSALGELIVCEVCVAGAQFSQVDSSHSSDEVDLSYAKSLEVQRGQWPAVIFQLTRCLSASKPNNAVAVAHSPIPVVYQRTLLAIPLEVSGRSYTTIHTAAMDEEIRVAAARCLDEAVTAIIGCGLHRSLQRVTVRDGDQINAESQSVVNMAASISMLMENLLTPETVSRIWAEGVLGRASTAAESTRRASYAAQPMKGQAEQRLAMTVVSAVAGIIRLRPALFTGGLIDRNGTNSFMTKFNPDPGAREICSTAITACVLSAATTGLLLPLCFPTCLGSAPLRQGAKACTPAACRRILSSQKFTEGLVRHFQSPNVLLRAKAYLLIGGVLDVSPGEALLEACKSRLPSSLERDLRTTNQHARHQPELNSSADSDLKETAEEGAVAAEEGSTAIHNDYRNASFRYSPDHQYLGMCCQYLADFMVFQLIPKICKQVGISIGIVRLPRTPSRSKLSSASNVSSRASSRVSKPKPLRRVISSSNLPSGVSLRTWLSAFSCIPGILASSPSLRNALLFQSCVASVSPCSSSSTYSDDRPSRFCLIAFIGMLLKHWASAATAGSASSFGVHHAGSLENQLLTITLTLCEDLCQQADLVEARKTHLIKHILFNLGDLAISPSSSPETRTICVKIIYDVKNMILGDCSSIFASNTSLDSVNSTKTNSGVSRVPSIPGVDELFCGTREPYELMSDTSGFGSKSSSKRISNTRNRPTSVYLDSSSKTALGRYRVTPTHRGVQGPSPDVLMDVYDFVRKLIVPEASRLIDYREPAPTTFFLQLILDCLHHQPSCVPDSNAAVLVNSLVKSWCAAHLDILLLRLLEQTLNATRVCDQVPFDGPASPVLLLRGRTPAIPPSSSAAPLTSGLPLLIIRLFIEMLHWPKDVRLVDLICAPSDSDFPSLMEVTSNLVLVLGSMILRRGRRESSAPSRSKNCTNSLKVRGTIPVLRVSALTSGIRHLLATLRLMNSQLSFIADVVRHALLCRQKQQQLRTLSSGVEPPCSARSFSQPTTARDPVDIMDCLPTENADICLIAEKLLVAARPANHLPGILASLLEASAESIKPLHEVCSNSGSKSDRSLRKRTTNRALIKGTISDEESDSEDELIAKELADLATNALANLASLYGGEYCRTALSAAGIRGFAVAFLRLSSQQKSFSTLVLIDESGIESRRHIRLLLRILRRLSDSDNCCAQRLAGPAAKHLQIAISRLRADAQRTDDAATVRLAGALLDRLNHTLVVF